MSTYYDLYLEQDDLPYATTEDLDILKLFKAKPNMTYAERKELYEKQRKDRLKKILVGVRTAGHNETYSLLMLGDHCQLDYPQDVSIDASQNTALHYVCQNFDTISSSNWEVINDVLEAGINPHLKNLRGETAVSYIKDLDLLKMIESITKSKRPEIFSQKEFDKHASHLQNEQP